MKVKLIILTALLSIVLSACAQEKKESKSINQSPPNIIYILADDMGIGDLGAYGQKIIQTPNLDKLAARGMKFTQHYSGSAVCAPSRSTLMTGQHTGHTPIRGNKEAGNGLEGQVPIPDNTLTLAELLKARGYTTGMFGKWGLGFGTGDPNNQGFDEFYGYNCQKLAHRYYPPYLNHNQTRDSLEGNDWTKKVTYAPDTIQEHRLQFLEDNKDKSFFAYIPLVLPHAEIISPHDSIFKLYDGKFKETSYTIDNKYTSDYGPDIVPHEYASVEKPLATYASMITRIDTYVGQIIDKVNELGLSENTIIMFSSDNGPSPEGGTNPNFFNSNAEFKGFKRDLYEGGIRAPFIVVWPNKVKEGSVTNHISTFWDVLPTLTELTDSKTPENIDGISFLPTLLNKKGQKQHDHLYWEFNIKGGRKAIRKGDWKGVWYNMNAKEQGDFELYNLSNDISETKNVAKNHPKIVKTLKQLLKDSSTESDLFPFN
ncbi:arylsulfatase [Tamlana sp. 2_MG-2023]|uniref:arylsulfatase n=1 Tax=unclassified Tamlana TaxID=2614803 RepID=UPI0026E41B9B|nr:MULTISPECIES: arylsulfatase [unclassified Tamlana]MDO6760985.1 arylsulfatase [Tamlana sp. 2_MG-2023]MDO6791241.1 arylsulfatase [Tamlana sp. 1_MG-2023]